jgi:hypothetical protein
LPRLAAIRILPVRRGLSLAPLLPHKTPWAQLRDRVLPGQGARYERLKQKADLCGRIVLILGGAKRGSEKTAQTTELLIVASLSRKPMHIGTEPHVVVAPMPGHGLSVKLDTERAALAIGLQSWQHLPHWLRHFADLRPSRRWLVARLVGDMSSVDISAEGHRPPSGRRPMAIRTYVWPSRSSTKGLAINAKLTGK